MVQRFLLLLLAVFGTSVGAQPGLAPSVQADLLRDKIFAQAKAHDADGVLASLDQYHKLAKDSNLAFPVPLYWIEAKAAHDSGDASRALSALKQFLNNTDQGSSQYKEALVLYPQYEQALSASNKLKEDIKRQALIARIPEVVAQIKASVVAMQGGELACPKAGTNVTLSCSKSFSDAKVAPFKVMKRCMPWLWWDVYAADTGKNSPWDELQGGTGCLYTFIASSSDARKISDNVYVPTKDDNVISTPDINGFVQWISAHTGAHWRFPTDTEFELMYQRAVNKPTKGQDPYPDMELGTSRCTTESDYFSQPNTYQKSCDAKTLELTNSCVADDKTPNAEANGPMDCEGKRRITVTLNQNLTVVFDHKGRITNGEHYSMQRGSYPDLRQPGSYLDREYKQDVEVQFRLVPEQ